MSEFWIVIITLGVTYALDELTPVVKKTKTKVDDHILGVAKKILSPLINMFKKRK